MHTDSDNMHIIIIILTVQPYTYTMLMQIFFIKKLAFLIQASLVLSWIIIDNDEVYHHILSIDIGMADRGIKS